MVVVFDYNKCEGKGECVNACPLELLELTENKRWCKPKDDKVDNKSSCEEFHTKVEKETNSVNIVIKFDVPDCIQCRSCETACPCGAITIEE